jgi:hypothetical protein
MTDPGDVGTSCPAMGSMGIHTESYYDEGICQLCGEQGPTIEEEEEEKE